MIQLEKRSDISKLTATRIADVPRNLRGHYETAVRVAANDINNGAAHAVENAMFLASMSMRDTYFGSTSEHRACDRDALYGMVKKYSEYDDSFIFRLDPGVLKADPMLVGFALKNVGDEAEASFPDDD